MGVGEERGSRRTSSTKLMTSHFRNNIFITSIFKYFWNLFLPCWRPAMTFEPTRIFWIFLTWFFNNGKAWKEFPFLVLSHRRRFVCGKIKRTFWQQNLIGKGNHRVSLLNRQKIVAWLKNTTEWFQQKRNQMMKYSKGLCFKIIINLTINILLKSHTQIVVIAEKIIS